MISKKSKITLFDIEEGELFAFDYQPTEWYRLMSFNADNNAVVRAQRAGAEDETANPYCGIIRKE
jgi:hypothetical protein